MEASMMTMPSTAIPPSTASAVTAAEDSHTNTATTGASVAPVAPVSGANIALPFPASSASLYVGELHPDVTESMLYDLFSQVGSVASIRVCRDVVTRRSLGYAYVNFHNSNDGERALDTLNYTVIKGQPCRIMWSQRDPALRRSGSGNVFIKNLDKSIDNKTLHDTFSAFGNILSCKVVTDENGSKGFGFVHFETQEAADQAISKVNGMLLADKKVFVGHHVPKKERVSKMEEMKARFTNIYVKNFDEGMSDEAFYEMFKAFGEITSHMVQRDEEGKSKGFGFVNYAHHDAARSAVDAMNGQDINGKVLTVCRAQSKSEREEELRRQYEAARQERNAQFKGVNLYVKNLDETVDDEKLRSEFAEFGAITSAKVMRDEKGHSKGFGFVCFTTTEEANKSLEMNGKLICNKPIFVALAQRKEDRRSVLEAQYAQRAQFRYQQNGWMGMGPAGAPGGAMYGGVPAPFMYATGGGMRGMMPPTSPNGYRPPAGGARWMPPAGYPMNAGPAGMNRFYPSANMMPSNASASAAGASSPPPSGGSGAAPPPPTSFPPSMMMMMPPPPPMMAGRMPFNQTVGRGGSMYRTSPPNAAGGGRGGYRSGPHANGASLMPGSPSMNFVGARRGGGSGGIAMNYRNGGGPGIRGNLRAGFPSSASDMMMMNVMGGGGYPGMHASPALTAAALAAAPPEVQKQMLGERLFPLIAARESELASKITGMLLDMDNGELLHLLESPEALSSKVNDAVTLLQQHHGSMKEKETDGTDGVAEEADEKEK